MARLVLAATLAANYGIYGPASSCCEHVPREPGSEEYLDSEKYQLRHWDLDARRQPRATSSRASTRIRARQPGAAAATGGLRFHPIDNDAADLLRARSTPDGDERRSSCVVNLDPHHTQSGWVTLDLRALGLDADAAVPGARPADRRALPVARRAQLRAARSRSARRRTCSGCAAACAPSSDFDYFL